MKYCKKCLARYTDNNQVCHDCHIELSDIKLYDPNAYSEFTRIADNVYARHILSRLDQSGVDYKVVKRENEDFRGLYFNMSFTECAVLVKNRDFDIARDSLKSKKKQPIIWLLLGFLGILFYLLNKL